MDVRYVQSFVTVVECGSLAEAARRLDLTPAAIAARIHALEEDLGAKLVERSGRSVKPTEAGLKVLDRARGVLRDVRDMRTLANDDAPLGELRLGVFISALTSVLPPVLRRLYAAYPDLAVFVAPGASIPKSCEWRALMIWATRGPHAALSLALLHEAEAIFSRPSPKVSALPRRRRA